MYINNAKLKKMLIINNAFHWNEMKLNRMKIIIRYN